MPGAALNLHKKLHRLHSSGSLWKVSTETKQTKLDLVLWYLSVYKFLRTSLILRTKWDTIADQRESSGHATTGNWAHWPSWYHSSITPVAHTTHPNSEDPRDKESSFWHHSGITPVLYTTNPNSKSFFRSVVKTEENIRNSLRCYLLECTVIIFYKSSFTYLPSEVSRIL